jgi:hypothetical protein
MRKLDGLSLAFIDFNISALTSGLISTETSLQLSECITVCAGCGIYTDSKEA